MEQQKILEELQLVERDIKEREEKYSILISEIDSKIENLIFLIEHDNFNYSVAYNYCKILKELLRKKKYYVNIRDKYKEILGVVNTDFIKREVKHKYRLLRGRKYTAKIFNTPEKIIEYLGYKE